MIVNIYLNTPDWENEYWQDSTASVVGEEQRSCLNCGRHKLSGGNCVPHPYTVECARWYPASEVQDHPSTPDYADGQVPDIRKSDGEFLVDVEIICGDDPAANTSETMLAKEAAAKFPDMRRYITHPDMGHVAWSFDLVAVTISRHYGGPTIVRGHYGADEHQDPDSSPDPDAITAAEHAASLEQQRREAEDEGALDALSGGDDDGENYDIPF
jgi:hypothetical protein